MSKKIKCQKEGCSNKAYPEEIIDLFTNNEDDTGSAYSASELDEFL